MLIENGKNDESLIICSCKKNNKIKKLLNFLKILQLSKVKEKSYLICKTLCNTVSKYAYV